LIRPIPNINFHATKGILPLIISPHLKNTVPVKFTENPSPPVAEKTRQVNFNF